MGIKVKSNRLREVAGAIERHAALGVQATATRLEKDLERTVWVDTGLVRRTTDVVDEAGVGDLSAKVGVGRRGRGRAGWGFYARFNEWGTRRQRARPRVGPAAHRAEVYFPVIMAREIKKACR